MWHAGLICSRDDQIWGVGPKKAIGLIKSGIKSVAALREAVAKQVREGGPPVLSSQQLVGLRCYDDLQKRIPRCVSRNPDAHAVAGRIAVSLPSHTSMCVEHGLCHLQG